MNLMLLTHNPSWTWPEDAENILLEVIKDQQNSEEDRLTAATLAGDMVVISDALVKQLLLILEDKSTSETIRGQAAISLGPVLEEGDTFGFDDPEEVPISEETFNNIQKALRTIYTDAGAPKLVRRRVLEAAIRAPQPWQQDAVRAAYGSGDDEWILSAVFCMQFLDGFDDQILESLHSDNDEIHFHAVQAAGAGQLKPAWSHIKKLVTSDGIKKPLRLAAMEALVAIRPDEAGQYLVDLADSDDEEIAEAADEAMMMAETEAQLEHFMDDDDDDVFGDDDDDA